MSNIVVTSHFIKQLKPLAKKYRHLKESIVQTLEGFDKDKYQALGKNTYKIRC